VRVAPARAEATAPLSPWLSPPAVMAAALLIRVAAALLSDRVVADVLRYHKVASHVLDVSWNPYLAPRLYPYPAAWIWIEVAAEWLARHAGLPFALAVKIPVVFADAALAGLLAGWVRDRRAAGLEGAAAWAGWAYALHPVAVLVSGFHGQFDAAALLALLYALRTLERGHSDRSALALAAGIALKSFPVLVLPFLLLFLPDARARVRYVLLAVVPVLLLLAPFALADPAALRRELLAYAGVADFGWIGALRAVRAAISGHLLRAGAEQWGALIPVSKLAFVLAAGALWWATAVRWLRWGREASALGVLLAFQVFYGALSAQYLLWPVPLALLLGERLTALHAAAATVALVGFYVLLAPGVLTPAEVPLMPAAVAQALWVGGTTLVWLVSAAWLIGLVRRARSVAA
jgi:hypothetical protein